jgi:hypothetical protein
MYRHLVTLIISSSDAGSRNAFARIAPVTTKGAKRNGTRDDFETERPLNIFAFKLALRRMTHPVGLLGCPSRYRAPADGYLTSFSNHTTENS